VLRTGTRAFVAPAGTLALGAGQDLGGEQEGDLPAPDATLAPTLTDAVIASVMHSEGYVTSAVLAPGATTFGRGGQFPGFDSNTFAPLRIATDTGGDAFIEPEDMTGSPR
jgi:hypothetical protein